ncbi:MAG: hypothetical protein WCV70_03955 [Patescibacteria group bacterium]
MKKIIFSLLSIALLFGLAGCAKKNTITVADGKGGFIQVEDKSSQKEEKAKKGDISTNICEEFTADFIYSIIKKPIVRVEPSKLATVYACDYFTDYKDDFYKDAKYDYVGAGGPSISIVLDNLSVAKQKEGREFLGLTLETSQRINMENIVSYRKDKSIWSIDLIINPNRFVWANYSHKAITDDELITLAAAMADKINGRLKINIEKNPIDLAEIKKAEMGESQEAVAISFLDKLSGKKIDEALQMMDANENTKQGWGVNFNTIESLKINKTEEAFKEECTPTRQTFKVELEVKVKPEGERLGWENGKNFRWITLEKNAGGVWLIHEIANNP